MGMAETFKALSEPQRREILTTLREGRMNAGEIAEKLGIVPTGLSYHLKLLKKADLIFEYNKNSDEKTAVLNRNNGKILDTSMIVIALMLRFPSLTFSAITSHKIFKI